MKPFTRTCVAFVLLAACGVAQDIVTAAPNNAKVLFENKRVRVVRLTMGPHEKLPPHDRPARVVIALSANNVTITGPDGKPRILHVPAGNIGWGDATHGRSVETLDSGFENIIVEIKNASEPAKKVNDPPSADDPRALIEPNHHWVLENQYVRVYDVHDPPEHEGQFHKHAFDSVVVKLTSATMSEHVPGTGWSKPYSLTAGQVSWVDYSDHPRVHRVRNLGKAEYHAVVVELMR